MSKTLHGQRAVREVNTTLHRLSDKSSINDLEGRSRSHSSVGHMSVSISGL